MDRNRHTHTTPASRASSSFGGSGSAATPRGRALTATSALTALFALLALFALGGVADAMDEEIPEDDVADGLHREK